MSDSSNYPPNIQDLTKKAEIIYDGLPENFIKSNNGKYIAIDVDSGDYFIGVSKEEAVKAAHAKYPGKIAFIRRIGGIEKVSRHFSSFLANL